MPSGEGGWLYAVCLVAIHGIPADTTPFVSCWEAKGLLEFLTRPLVAILDALAGWTGSFGLAVIFLTIIVRLILLPFALKGLRSAARMRELQPKLKEITDRYKDDPQEQQKRMMAFYKEHNFNPLGGCLPTLLQFPVMIGLYRVLLVFPTRLEESPDLFEGVSTAFLGVDLTQVGQWSSNLSELWATSSGPLMLAVVAAITTFISLMVGPGEASQKKMMAPFALMTLYIGVIVPAGVALYIITTNLFTAAQQFFVRGSVQTASSNDSKG